MSEHISYERAPCVSEAINTRRSLRDFLPQPVPQSLIEQILTTAARAPSGTNMQPWKTYVVTGSTREKLCDTCCTAFDEKSGEYTSETRYYPEEWFEPYLARRREVGWALYNLLGITKGDRERTFAQHRKNYQFFGAPVGLIFTIHRDLATDSWLDYGMFMQNIMLLAREQGLHSCPQAAWADYHEPVRQVLPLTKDEMVVCGLALGYANSAAIENSLVTSRVPLTDHTTFLD